MMKLQQIFIPFILALIASIGNAFVTIGQKKASSFSNPFFFGAFSLLFASATLFIVALFFGTKGLSNYIYVNSKWFATTGLGLVLLNIFLYFLYRNYGAAYYTLYAILAIATTSIIVAIFMFNEKMNLYYFISLAFALLTIIFFMKGKSSLSN
ncbi:MAG: EamA family transporter [Saprospiraceae bacterium]|nr:EamA family transporter [Candidatus Defluviibacterium haderslevense]